MPAVLYLSTSYAVQFTHVYLCYPLFPSVAMDMLFLWQLEVFMDGFGLHCKGLWTFLYPFPSSSLTNHTSRIHNAVHLCLDLTPYIYSRAPPFSLHTLVMWCTRSHNVSIIFSAHCVLQKNNRARKCHWRPLQCWDTACWNCDQIYSMHALEIRVSASSFLIFNSNRNPSFFFKDAWDILSHGE